MEDGQIPTMNGDRGDIPETIASSICQVNSTKFYGLLSKFFPDLPKIDRMGIHSVFNPKATYYRERDYPYLKRESLFFFLDGGQVEEQSVIAYLQVFGCAELQKLVDEARQGVYVSKSDLPPQIYLIYAQQNRKKFVAIRSGIIKGRLHGRDSFIVSHAVGNQYVLIKGGLKWNQWAKQKAHPDDQVLDLPPCGLIGSKKVFHYTARSLENAPRRGRVTIAEEKPAIVEPARETRKVTNPTTQMSKVLACKITHRQTFHNFNSENIIIQRIGPNFQKYQLMVGGGEAEYIQKSMIQLLDDVNREAIQFSELDYLLETGLDGSVKLGRLPPELGHAQPELGE